MKAEDHPRDFHGPCYEVTKSLLPTFHGSELNLRAILMCKEGQDMSSNSVPSRREAGEQASFHLRN
jgi:hypothetical protein